MLFCHGLCDFTQISKMGKFLIHESYSIYYFFWLFHQKPIDCTDGFHFYPRLYEGTPFSDFSIFTPLHAFFGIFFNKIGIYYLDLA